MSEIVNGGLAKRNSEMSIHVHVEERDLEIALEDGTLNSTLVKALAADLKALRAAIKIYDVETFAVEAYRKYLVYVINHGWTDGIYQLSTDSPSGWCHKWALDSGLIDLPTRGVQRFCELPEHGPASDVCDACAITAYNDTISTKIKEEESK